MTSKTKAEKGAAVQDKWALEEHFSTTENNAQWDSAGESARNGKAVTDYVEAHLLGEGLPFLLPRLEHRLDKQRDGLGLGTARRPVSHYFSNNFYVTTSGHFHTRTLFNTISEIGVDRVMFSADYPYETMEEAAAWFDTSLLSHNDSVKVGRENARRLLGASVPGAPTPGRSR